MPKFAPEREKPYFVVYSAVRDFCKENNIRCATDFPPALNAKIKIMVLDAIKRAHDNNRNTLFPGDI